jgi:hypothetical protein
MRVVREGAAPTI